MDIFGHHACVCPVKGDRIKRHNIIRDILFDFCSSAAWAPVKEKAFLFAGSAERPADIFIPNYSCGKSLVLDNAVTCPLQHKYVVNAAQSTGFACNDYADEIKSSLLNPVFKRKVFCIFLQFLNLLEGFQETSQISF